MKGVFFGIEQGLVSKIKFSLQLLREHCLRSLTMQLLIRFVDLLCSDIRRDFFFPRDKMISGTMFLIIVFIATLSHCCCDNVTMSSFMRETNLRIDNLG